jgi:ATP-binding cassette subfamily F protein 3
MAQSLIKKIRVERIEVDEDDNSVMNITFPVSKEPGRVVVKAENVTKSYRDKILKDINLLVERGSKIAFVGKTDKEIDFHQSFVEYKGKYQVRA